MSAKTSLPIDWTNDQWATYQQIIEMLLANRLRQGTLLSSFDLIAGASSLFFLTDNNNRMPASWVFMGVRDGGLPDGILEISQRLDERLKTTNETLDQLDNMVDEIAKLHTEVEQLRRRTHKLVAALKQQQDRQDEHAFKPQLPVA